MDPGESVDEPFFEVKEGRVSIRVRVKPRASKSAVLGVRGSELQVAVRSAPVDGAANEELVRVLAEHFAVPKSSVVIQRGQAGRSKIVILTLASTKLDEFVERLRSGGSP
jgi:uncharacterized protein (TIGR00251 family)